MQTYYSHNSKSGSGLLLAVVTIWLMTVPGSSLFADDVTAESDDNLNLPDFTRTYGFDSRPDVRLNNNGESPEERKQRLSSLKKRLKSKVTGTTKSGTKYGVQRYTRESGRRRYGVGFKKKIGKNTRHGIVVHDKGANYEVENKGRKFYLGVDQRKPVSTNSQEQSTYLFFGLKFRW